MPGPKAKLFPLFKLFSLFILLSSFFVPAALAAPPFSQDDHFMNTPNTAPSTTPPIDHLEIVGVGISVETWRNHPSYPQFNLWHAVQAAQGDYIISQDARKYPKNLEEWQMLGAKRKEDVVEIAMREFMDRYPLPIAVFGPSLQGPAAHDATEIESTLRANASSFVITKSTEPYTHVGEFAGLLTQSGQVTNSYLNDNPDRFWQTLFNTFDQNPDMPAAGIAAKDGVIQRAASFYEHDREKFEKLAANAYGIKHARIPSDNWTFLTLIRRGRIDWLRPYVRFVQDNMRVKNRGGEPSRNRSQFVGWNTPHHPPFTPTPYIPKPWTAFQIDQFDHLEILGRVQRPQVITYLDEQGKPLKKAARNARMETALRAVLAPLGGTLPTRIFYDYGIDNPNAALRWTPFVEAVQALDEDFSLSDPQQAYNLASILGDLGTGSPFVAVALATMAGLQSGGPTLIANLRRDDGATLLLVTPPTAAERARDAAIKRPFWPRFYGF